jgi:MFS family permease
MWRVDDVGRLAKVTRLVRSAIAELLDQSKPFGRLALVHSLQGAGSSFITISLAGSLFFSISPHAAEGKVLLYLVLTIAPFALVGPALSPLLDRGRQARRASVAVASGGSALLCLFMARAVHSLLLFPEAFAILVLAKLYLVAKASLVPALADHSDDFAIANAKLAVLASVAGFAAFPFGVAALQIGPQWVLLLGALVFVAGMGAALRLPRTVAGAGVARVAGEPADVAPADLPADAPYGLGLSDLGLVDPGSTTRAASDAGGTGRQGSTRGRSARPPRGGASRILASLLHRLRAVREARLRVGLRLYPRDVLAAISAMAVGRGMVGFVEFFLAFALKREHAATWWYGLLLVATGAGSLMGSMLVPRLRRYLSEPLIIVAALVAMVVGGLAAALVGGLWAQALLTFVVGAGPTSAKPALDSIVQRHVPPALLGRAFGRLETRLQLVWVLAALAAVLIPFSLVWGDVVVAASCAVGALSYGTTAGVRLAMASRASEGQRASRARAGGARRGQL